MHMHMVRIEILRCPDCYMVWEAPVYALSSGEYFKEDDLACPSDECAGEGEILPPTTAKKSSTREKTRKPTSTGTKVAVSEAT